MATNPNRLAGTAYFAINGVSYMLQGEFAYSPGTVNRESLSGMDTVHGFKEKPRPPFISCTLRDAKNVTVADFNAMDSETITVELANGKTIIGRNMWTVEAQEVKSEDATFDVRFEGPQGAVTEN
jgi:hypothetical protein